MAIPPEKLASGDNPPQASPPSGKTLAPDNSSAVHDSQQSSNTPDQDTTTRNPQDMEGGIAGTEKGQPKNVSAFRSLGWLDRFLALWIFLAMAVGIILGNFVPETGPALEKGKFVGVSVPIGKSPMLPLAGRSESC